MTYQRISSGKKSCYAAVVYSYLIEEKMDQAEVTSEVRIVAQPELWRSQANTPASKRPA